MKYYYYLALLGSFLSCQSVKLCQQTEQVFIEKLDTSYWIINRIRPNTFHISAKTQFELLYYYPEIEPFRAIDSDKPPQLKGFSYRTFEAPYQIALTFKPKTYTAKRHQNKEWQRMAYYRKDNLKSTMLPRKKISHQHYSIILTTQFDSYGSINGLTHLDTTTQSFVQLNQLIHIVNRQFNTPKELQKWTTKKDLYEMPIEYLDGIQSGKYYANPTGGLLPAWEQ